MKHPILLCLLLCYSALSIEHYCLKFSTDNKAEHKFVNIQIGTPLTAYRLLICSSPKISNMNFYQTILSRESFGSSMSDSFASRFKDRNSGMNMDHHSFTKPLDEMYYDSFSSKLYSNMYSHRDETLSNVEEFSKSVTFEEMYADQWSTIGQDYSRSIDGTWFKIGLEISNLNSPQKFFDSYCNPGGLGDQTAPSSYLYDSSKYGQIDGVFLLGLPNIYLVSTYDVHQTGSSTVMIDDKILQYCYQKSDIPLNLAMDMPQNSIISSKISKFKDYKHNNRINLNTKSSNSVIYADSVTGSLVNGKKILPKNNTGKHFQDVVSSKFTLNVGNNNRLPRFVLDNHVLDIPYDTNSDFSYDLNIKNNEFSDINFGKMPSFFKANSVSKSILQASKRRLEGVISNKISNNKRSNGDNVDNRGYKIKILLSQPYNYLPQEIFRNYVSDKNFVVDIPDQTWQKLCLTSEFSSESFCIGPTSIVKSEYLSGGKNGYIEYFPKSLSSYVSHINILRGGKILGNTIIDRSPRSIKVSGDFEKTQNSYMVDNYDDAYFRYALSNLVPTSSEIFTETKNFMDFGQSRTFKKYQNHKRYQHGTTSGRNDVFDKLKSRFDFIKSNKLLILPHFLDKSTIYIGTSAIYQNYGGFKIVTDHFNESSYIFTSNPVGISKIFLPLNADFDDGQAFVFFVLVVIYGVCLIGNIYILSSTWKMSTFFPKLMVAFYRGTYMDHKLSMEIINSEKKRNNYIAESFLKNPKRPVFLKDVFLSLFSFVFAFMIFLVFGVPSLLVVSETYQQNMLSQYTINDYKNDHTIYSENFLVLPQDPSGAFVVVLILCFSVCLLSLIGVIFHQYSTFFSDGCIKKDNFYHRLYKAKEWLNTLVISRAYLNVVTDISKHRIQEKNGVMVYNPHFYSNDKSDKSGIFMDNNEKRNKKSSSSSPNGIIFVDTIDSETELKMSVFNFVYGNLMIIIFFTSTIQFSTTYFSSFILLRLWAFVGIVIQIVFSFSGTLCILYLFFVLTKPYTILKMLKTRLPEKNKVILMFVFYGLLVISIFLINSISFVFFLVPFELGTYQSDYSASLTKYLVSFSALLMILTVTQIIWSSLWRSRPYVTMLMTELLKKNK